MSILNDILVFKVEQPFDLSPTVQLVKMPAQGFLPKGNIHISLSLARYQKVFKVS
jgi:hypothetical protein